MSFGGDKEKLLERFKSDTRSILLSAPLGVLRRAFIRDYRSMIGSDPPLHQLGYSNMDEFARRHPDVLRSAIGPTGEVTYYVVATEETKHVASLVARQKKPSITKLRKASVARPPPNNARRAAPFGVPNRRSNRPIKKSLYGAPMYDGYLFKIVVIMLKFFLFSSPVFPFFCPSSPPSPSPSSLRFLRF